MNGRRSRNVIRLEPGRLHEYAAACERLLAEEAYVRGGALTRIGTAPELVQVGPAIKRDERQAVIIPVTAEHLRRRLTELAEFQVYRRREQEWVPVDCPKDLAANILGTGEWPAFRPLTAIASAPFIRPDLTICTTAGYDSSTGVFFRPSQTFPAIPASPTRAEAEAALATLLEPFSEFPYAAPAHSATFLSNVLTAAVRVTLPTSPVFVYSAPNAGSGKTLLAKMPNLITTGIDPAMRPHTDESEELRKVLFGALRAGDPTLLFDNAQNGMKFRSPVLCGFATAINYADRPLGSSDSRTLPNRAIVTVTGNNITPCGDLARRSLVVRLDVNAESTKGRRFKIENLLEHVLRERPKLLAAALTIIRAHTTAGSPATATPLASFENWSRLCRDPLTWLGMADAVDSQESETDDEVDATRDAFKALALAFGTREFTSREITETMGPTATELRDALTTAGCSDSDDVTKVGYWLRANRDKVAAGLKLVAKSGHSGRPKWRVRGL